MKNLSYENSYKLIFYGWFIMKNGRFWRKIIFNEAKFDRKMVNIGVQALWVSSDWRLGEVKSNSWKWQFPNRIKKAKFRLW